MTGKLPININNLLRQRTIEGERVEYKAGWIRRKCCTPSAPSPTTFTI